MRVGFEDRVALLASFALLMLPFGYAPLTLQALPPAWTWIITALVSLSNVAIVVLGNVGSRMLTAWALVPLFPGSGLVGAAQVILVSCSMLILPPTLGTAILRSHLWDIDVIIHRSLVYSLLTISLGLLYAALVIGLQALLQGITGGNQVALVGSTLAIAAAFQPFRGRIRTLPTAAFTAANTMQPRRSPPSAPRCVTR